MQVQVTRLLGATSKGSTPTLNFLGASGTALSDQRPVLVRVDAVLTGSAACLEDIVPALFLHSKQQSRQTAEQRLGPLHRPEIAKRSLQRYSPLCQEAVTAAGDVSERLCATLP